ncbi:MAG TPA: DUF1801 domain-containing protein [Candidatus Acidoferrum sp.]|nr:DUF1801 domain-containing protein [Candidatus Acidoferrum sp.]
MPTMEGKEARLWIDRYVANGGKMRGVAKAVRGLVKKNVAGCEEYVNPWKIPTFDLNGPLCFYMVAKSHVVFGFMRGAMLRDPEKLLEGTGKYLRHVKLRSAAEVRRPGVRALLKEAAALNRKKPVTGTAVQMNKRRAERAQAAKRVRTR